MNRYPLYSQADRATLLDGFATIAERTEHNDVAGQYYAHIVKDYPLSPLAAPSKEKLEKFGAPVPQPDPTALARMQKEQQIPRQRTGIFMRAPEGILKSSPDVRMAARTGTPTMTPEESETGDLLTPGGLGVVGGATGGTTGSTGTGAFVETVTPAHVGFSGRRNRSTDRRSAS